MKLKRIPPAVHPGHARYGGKTPFLGGAGQAIPQGRTGAGRCWVSGTSRTAEKDGMKETEASIANKIGRGTFSATFLLASLKAIEADVLRLESV